ncbi:MAG: transglutaminase family protein [Clostridiales bacterium]|nr:transglutaminase family protein [Clostridiales bacterium]
MKLWKLTYELSSEFSAPVVRHHYTLRCLPRDSFSQKVHSCKCKVFPSSESTKEKDSFGNHMLIGCCPLPHDRFVVEMSATVIRECRPEPEPLSSWRLGMYRTVTPWTAMGPELTEFYETMESGLDPDPWKRTKELMEALFGVFRYESGSAVFDTTAEQAFAQRKGVCQDYAHILLTLCRHGGLTARYVAGVIPGEGETHAWIEVLSDSFWKGFDPTNNRETNEEYICLAVGRDAHDCVLNKGIFLGNAGQSQHVHVKMEEI